MADLLRRARKHNVDTVNRLYRLFAVGVVLLDLAVAFGAVGLAVE